LVVTHDPGELIEIADRCWTINHGVLQPMEPTALNR
ncbi:MAG: hypothetical protein RLZZ171_2103, partial [Cyanobacteriota bacterium]